MAKGRTGRFAAAHLTPGLVLDCGCGTGYGDEILSQAGLEVIAGDLSSDAVRGANEAYPCAGRVVFNAEALPLRSETFDAAVCFEVMEHVHHPDKLCAEIAAAVRPGGTVMVSVPSEENLHEKLRPNPYHLRLYSPETLREQLQPYFTVDELLAQRPPFDLNTSSISHPLNRLVIRIKRALGIQGRLLSQRTWERLWKRISPGPEWVAEDDDFLPKPDQFEDAMTLFAVCTKA